MPRLKLAVLLFAAAPLFGAPLTWTGAISSDWSEPGNWSPAVVPQEGDDLTFPAGAANRNVVHDLGDGFTVRDIVFNGEYTLDGNALTVNRNFFTSNAPFVSNVDLTIGSAGFKQNSRRAAFNGAMNVNGHKWSGFIYYLTLNGPLNGSGEVVLDGSDNVITSTGDFSGTLSAGFTGEMLLDGWLPDATFVAGKLRGNGAIGSIALANARSSVAPGSSGATESHAAGTLSTGALELTTSALQIDIHAGAASDAVEVDGPVFLDDARLEVTVAGNAPSPGDSFVIVDNFGSDAVTGTFAGLPEGAAVDAPPSRFRISYSGGDGNDVVLTAVVVKTTSIAFSYDPPMPVVHGQPVSLVATVTSPDGVPEGTVTFYRRYFFAEFFVESELATVPLIDGVATFPMQYQERGRLPIFPDSFAARYNGSGEYAATSRTPFVAPRIRPAATETTVRASSSPSAAGQPVTFTATVRVLAPSVLTPREGFVRFTIDGVNQPFTRFADGPASLTRTLEAGTYTVKAEFFDQNYGSMYEASSATIVHTVVDPASAPLSLSVAGFGLAEGDRGTTDAAVTVQLSAPSQQSVTVGYRTEDGTGRAGRDYVAASGTLTFAPGETAKTIRVTILGDGVPEHDRTFSVVLTSPVNATIAAGTAAITIVNDDVTFRTDTYGYTSELEVRVDTPVSGSGPFPAIVWIPGTAEYAPDGDTPAVRETARGYVVVTPEYRAAGTAPFPTQLDDLQAAIRWIRANAARLNVDPSRIAVWGSGTGAHLALLLGTMGDRPATVSNPAVSHRVQAVVAWSAPSDLTRLQADACSGVTAGAAQQVLLGCPPSTCGAQASPVTHVTSDDAPMLLVHGSRDCTVGPAQSRRLHATLTAAGVQASLQLVDAGDVAEAWWFSEPAFTLAEHFLDARLKGSRPKRRAVH